MEIEVQNALVNLKGIWEVELKIKLKYLGGNRYQ